MHKLADQVFEAFTGYLKRWGDPVLARLKVLEDRPIAKDGERGEKGEKGDIGERGTDGIQGATGERGPQGEKGEQGVRGDPGERGEKGEKGEVGPAGERGEKGDVGPPGNDGAMGEKGEPGTAGRDGIDGAKGEQGERGEKGDSGERGPIGEKGDPGADGKDGVPGERGPQGEKGMDGRDGVEGQPGKDALQIEVISMIDPERKYQRGTWASHKGGLFRSFRVTDPLGDDFSKAGWECIVNGVASLDAVLGDDLRTLSLDIRTSDGKAVSKSVNIPAVVDRGVFRESESYAKGDAVTWGGNYCIAQKDAPQGKPGESEDWRIAVKKGDRGADVYQVAKRNGFVGTEAQWLEHLRTGEVPAREPVRLR